MSKNKSENNTVIGKFSYADDTEKAIKALREKGFEDLTLYSPIPEHHLDDVMYEGKRRSPVRMFTLIGGLTGCIGAFIMTSWMSIDYPIRVSAKPLISVPAFVVIAFECTILLGAISTLIGMLHNSRIPNFFANPGYRKEFSEDKFGLVVSTTPDKLEEAQRALESVSAEDIELEYNR